jgi:transcription initiation factor TFIIB
MQTKKTSWKNKLEIWRHCDKNDHPLPKKRKFHEMEESDVATEMVSSTKDFCSTCHAILAVTEEGFFACTNAQCSLLYKDVIDHTAEWRFYGADDHQVTDPARCGIPINPLLHESSFGCKIIPSGHRMTYEMHKIKRFIEWQSAPYKEKKQYSDFQYITDMAQKAGITKAIIDDALIYRKKISEYAVTYRGDNRDGIIAASVYLSCRKNHAPRSAQEIAEIFHLDVSSATKGCKNSMLIINDLEKTLDAKEKTTFCQTKPEAFLERFCSKLNMSMEIKKLCMFISKKIDTLNAMPENTPQSIASAIIFFVVHLTGLPIEKKAIAKISSISLVTITKCYKKLDHIRKEIVPGIILSKYNIL